MEAARDIQDSPPEFDAFFAEHFPPLVRYLCARGASEHDAQDIAQESLFKLTRYRGHPASVLKVLLYRIALNGLCDLRRRGRNGGDFAPLSMDATQLDIPCESPTPDSRAEQQQELAHVRAAITQLPQRCREIYLLNRIDGMSYREISAHCGISVKAVEKHMGKALSSLRRTLLSAVPGHPGRSP